jgi:hypothetical protein
MNKKELPKRKKNQINLKRSKKKRRNRILLLKNRQIRKPKLEKKRLLRMLRMRSLLRRKQIKMLLKL